MEPRSEGSRAARALLVATAATAAAFLLLTLDRGISPQDPVQPRVSDHRSASTTDGGDREAVKVVVTVIETVTVTVTVVPAPARSDTAPPHADNSPALAVVDRYRYADALALGTSARRFPWCDAGCGPRFPPPPRQVPGLATHLVCLGASVSTRACSASNVCYDASVPDKSRRLRFFTGAQQPLHPAAVGAAASARAQRPCLRTHATPRDGETNATADDSGAWVCDGDDAFWAAVLQTKAVSALVPQVRGLGADGTCWQQPRGSHHPSAPLTTSPRRSPTARSPQTRWRRGWRSP